MVASTPSAPSNVIQLPARRETPPQPKSPAEFEDLARSAFGVPFGADHTSQIAGVICLASVAFEVFMQVHLEERTDFVQTGGAALLELIGRLEEMKASASLKCNAMHKGQLLSSIEQNIFDARDLPVVQTPHLEAANLETITVTLSAALVGCELIEATPELKLVRELARTLEKRVRAHRRALAAQAAATATPEIGTQDVEAEPTTT